MFKEALSCYSAGCFNAFGSMSRRTAQSLFRELGERGKLELFDTLQEIRALAELDDDTFAALRSVLFGSDSDPWPNQPQLDAERAGILLEVMRDLLYQTFVRKARLLQAMTFRKFVAPSAGRDQPPDRAACESRRARSAEEHPRIAEQPHPAAVLRPTPWAPRSSAPCETPAPDAASATVTRPSALHSPAMPSGEPFGLQGYCSRRLVAIVDDTAASPALRRAACARSAPAVEFRAALAVRHRDRQHRAVHAGEQHRVRTRHLHQGQARLVLLGAVAHEARPVLGARESTP